MGKNNKYRDYSNYKKQKEAEEAVEEITEDLPNTPEDPEDPQGLNFDYINKEEVDTKGLDANTVAKEYPKGKIACDRLNVRTSPEVKSNNISGVYAKGTIVTILEDNGDWLTVELSKNSNSIRGFVMSKFIER